MCEKTVHFKQLLTGYTQEFLVICIHYPRLGETFVLMVHAQDDLYVSEQREQN